MLRKRVFSARARLQADTSLVSGLLGVQALVKKAGGSAVQKLPCLKPSS